MPMLIAPEAIKSRATGDLTQTLQITYLARSGDAQDQKVLSDKLMKDACYKKVKASYKVFPSARASQAIAKCRKESGNVRKGEKGSDLKRWEKEKWVDQKTGKSCGAGGSNEYCRPTKRVSGETPKTAKELGRSAIQSKIAEKARVGMGARVSPVKK